MIYLHRILPFLNILFGLLAIKDEAIALTSLFSRAIIQPDIGACREKGTSLPKVERVLFVQAALSTVVTKEKVGDFN